MYRHFIFSYVRPRQWLAQSVNIILRRVQCQQCLRLVIVLEVEECLSYGLAIQI